MLKTTLNIKVVQNSAYGFCLLRVVVIDLNTHVLCVLYKISVLALSKPDWTAPLFSLVRAMFEMGQPRNPRQLVILGTKFIFYL